MLNVRHAWELLRSSLWFVPSLITIGSLVLAVALVEVDVRIPARAFDHWPLVFGSSPAGARGMLAAIATSMITVTGVVFSITIVAFSLAATQYSPRVLRNFMRDRSNQSVLGVFLGVFVYCLVVLRTVRGGNNAFVPSVSVLGAVLYALVAIGFLIYFIHHITSTIQASHIVAQVAAETVYAVDRLFPSELGEGPEDSASLCPEELPADGRWRALPAMQTGYIQTLAGDALLEFAERHQTVVRMERGVGEFVIKGLPLVSILERAGSTADAPPDPIELERIYAIDRNRSIEQDAAFGILQIVDVALKGLSPGINDVTTAIISIDFLTAILARLANRQLPSRYRQKDGQLRVIACGPTFELLVSAALDEIRRNAQGQVSVLLQLLRALHTIERLTSNRERRECLRREGQLILEVAERSVPCPADRAQIQAAATELFANLDGPSQPCSAASRS